MTEQCAICLLKAHVLFVKLCQALSHSQLVDMLGYQTNEYSLYYLQTESNLPEYSQWISITFRTHYLESESYTTEHFSLFPEPPVFDWIIVVCCVVFSQRMPDCYVKHASFWRSL